MMKKMCRLYFNKIARLLIPFANNTVVIDPYCVINIYIGSLVVGHISL